MTASRRPQEAAPHTSDSTTGLWQRRTSRQLTPEDAREIRENMTGFFRVLMEWQARTADTPRKTGIDAEP